MVELLESHGVLVFWTNVEGRALDAYCRWDGERPIVILNSHERSGERSRFNLAHELAHLLLHREALYTQTDEGDDLGD